MDKLWMVIYAGTQIGGTVGPLPYDMPECERRAAEFNQKIEAAKSNPEFIAKAAKDGMPKFSCEYHVNRPVITAE